jgi:pimeloyl-ACP methyl ester carboxylesterase
MKLHSNIFGQGQPFIILHGFLGMGDNWKSLGKKFSVQGYEMHLVDQRNHGRSPHDETFNYRALTEDLKTYCDNKQLKHIILMGHSMGGKTAMFFASKYPEMISKLMVADISPRYYPVHHKTILNGLASLDLAVLKSRKQADEVLADYVSDFGTRLFLLKNLYWKDKEQLGLRINLKILTEQVESVGEAFPELLKFEGDTLFLRGSRSDYILLQDEDLIEKHFPGAGVTTINNAGHWLHADNPYEFYDKVTQFIN